MARNHLSWRYWMVVTAAVITGIASFVLWQWTVPAKRTVVAWIPIAPWTADPIDSNFISHQMVFRSVSSTLVSRHRLGGYTGLIADKWVTTDDRQTWTFHIRSGSLFDNGDPITPSSIVAAWTRAGFRFSTSKRKGTLFEDLLEAEKIDSPRASVAGLQATADSVTLRFTRPEPGLLDTLSSATYAIVHPSDYDPNNGAWINPTRLIASGPYKIMHWDEKSIELIRRPEVIHPDFHTRALQNIKFVWQPDARLSADLALGHSLSTKPSEDYQFYGGPVSGIAL